MADSFPFFDHDGFDSDQSSWYGNDHEGLDFLHDLPADEHDWQSIAFRMLAGKDKKDEGRMDYSALSVAVMTLGLIMVVEVIRHKLDHAALGKPYFEAVLENIYAECECSNRSLLPV